MSIFLNLHEIRLVFTTAVTKPMIYQRGYQTHLGGLGPGLHWKICTALVEQPTRNSDPLVETLLLCVWFSKVRIVATFSKGQCSRGLDWR